MTKTPQVDALPGMTPLGLKAPASNLLPTALPDLGYFSGTEHYYAYNPFLSKMLPARFGRSLQYTDGVKHIAETAAAYWLLDVVFSHVIDIYRKASIEDDQKRLLVCKLRRHAYDGMPNQTKGNSALFTVDDGNNNTLAMQEIEFTDFPAMTCDIWVQNGVALLPSEY